MNTKQIIQDTTCDLNIPEITLNRWQEITDILAKIIDVPAALIMHTEDEFMEVFVSSKTEGNQYSPGDREKWHGLYCKTVIESQNELLVPNALRDKDWDKNPDIKLGMISYLGYPINYPNNKPFGTICILDYKENKFSEIHKKLILQFRDVIEKDLVQAYNIANSKTELKKLSVAVEQSANTIVITDLDGNIEYTNPKFTDITGYTATEAVGQNPKILNSGYQPKEYYDDLWKTITKGEVWKGEFHNKKKNGKYFWEQVTITPIKNDKNEIINYLAIKEDITARKKTEHELIIAKEKAEESDRLKSAFLANMSHEIRTPMNGILGFAELLKVPYLTGAEQQKYIDLIEKSSLRMLDIINNIINISRIDSGVIDINFNKTNINEQIEFIYNFFKPEAEDKGLLLSYDKQLPFDATFIKTDTEKLLGILTNLVKNAIKFSDKGSIKFGYYKKKQNFEFFVKDTGIGIDKSRHKAVFKRFIQAETTNRNAQQGAGLGLPITKSYVEMLGGKIWLESEKGKGSTFYFTIPIQ